MRVFAAIAVCAVAAVLSCGWGGEEVGHRPKEVASTPTPIPQEKLPDFIGANFTVMVANSLWPASWGWRGEKSGGKDMVVFVVPFTLRPDLLPRDLLVTLLTDLENGCSGIFGGDAFSARRLPVVLPKEDERFDYRSFAELCDAWNVRAAPGRRDGSSLARPEPSSVFSVWEMVKARFIQGKINITRAALLAYSDPYVAKYTIEYPRKWVGERFSSTRPPIGEQENLGCIVGTIEIDPFASQRNFWVIVGGDKIGGFFAFQPEIAKELRVLATVRF